MHAKVKLLAIIPWRYCVVRTILMPLNVVMIVNVGVALCVRVSVRMCEAMQ